MAVTDSPNGSPNGSPNDSPNDGDATSTPVPAHEQQRVDELIRRGAAQMRATPAPGWFDVASRVSGALRTASRRSVEIDAAWPGAGPEAAGDRLAVSDLVVIDALRRALTGVPRCQPSAVDLLLEEHRDPDGRSTRRCMGAYVSLVATFDVDLREAAEHTRRLTLETLADLLGPPPEGLSRDAVVDVEIVDVTTDDPRR